MSAPITHTPTLDPAPHDPAPVQSEQRVQGATRTLLKGLKRGVRRRCPNCGEGPLFAGYPKVEPVCPRCGNDNGRYPADDGPAYSTIFLIGHLVIAPGLALTVLRGWSPLGLLAVGLPTLAALPFIKGAWIGVLWSVGGKD